ncbi:MULTISPECIES: hypothetical protein [Bacillus]|uniref:Uncharacterized protein n=1 Tax=Bacillus wiedmannii TaxID=1890302 RepID=A0A2C4M185_9BACI|nr:MULTISPECIES: hypothetical protein [Bacillus cereus group]KAA0783311.1 hypothetical protein DN394_27550 [Bacillus sp. BB081]KXY80008.1 hypothetical protein AT258_03880 [Bacillus wiedmannii]PEK62715.1 hypothetical protein CN595_08575 [Bacillus wiedmannii]PEL15384.1 hypothetical protein CN599_25070 [Bacillus wiedmannii]PEM45584.1 hypothetical protein CN618_26165 [Bacillus wiedmannii]
MNKDSKTVKKEKGFFEGVIAPIIVGSMFIFLLLYKVAEFLGKWLIILSIPSYIVTMFIFLYQKEYGGVLVCGIGLILMLSLYFVFVKKSKKG